MSTQTNPSTTLPTAITPPSTTTGSITTDPALQTQAEEGVVDQAMTTDGFKDPKKPVETPVIDETTAKPAGDETETTQKECKDCCAIGGGGAASKLRSVFGRGKKGEDAAKDEGKGDEGKTADAEAK